MKQTQNAEIKIRIHYLSIQHLWLPRDLLCPKAWYDGLKEIGQFWLICLNTWSPVVRTIWEKGIGVNCWNRYAKEKYEEKGKGRKAGGGYECLLLLPVCSFSMLAISNKDMSSHLFIYNTVHFSLSVFHRTHHNLSNTLMSALLHTSHCPWRT